MSSYIFFMSDLQTTQQMVLPHTDMWQKVQQEFEGSMGHTFDLMLLDFNIPKDQFGNSLPHFTPVPSPGSAGVNFFAQDLTTLGPSCNPICFSTSSLGLSSPTLFAKYEASMHNRCPGQLPQKILVAVITPLCKERYKNGFYRGW